MTRYLLLFGCGAACLLFALVTLYTQTHSTGTAATASPQPTVVPSQLPPPPHTLGAASLQALRSADLHGMYRLLARERAPLAELLWLEQSVFVNLTAERDARFLAIHGLSKGAGRYEMRCLHHREHSDDQAAISELCHRNHLAKQQLYVLPSGAIGHRIAEADYCLSTKAGDGGHQVAVFKRCAVDDADQQWQEVPGRGLVHRRSQLCLTRERDFQPVRLTPCQGGIGSLHHRQAYMLVDGQQTQQPVKAREWLRAIAWQCEHRGD